VKEAGFNSVGAVVGIRRIAQVAIAVVHARIPVDEGIGQERENAADAALVLQVGLAQAGLAGWRGEQIAQAGILVLAGVLVERIAVAKEDAGDGAILGFHLLFEARFAAGAALNPIAEVAVALMVVEFVVDGFAHQGGRILRRGGLCERGRCQSDGRGKDREHTHRVCSRG